MNNISALFRKLIVGVLLSLFLAIPRFATAQPAAPTNLQAVLIDDLLGIVELSWDLPPDTGFQFTLIKVNGAGIGTSTMLCPCNFIHHLSGYGITCYTVQAFYDQGVSDPVTTCIEWLPPEIMIDPSSCYMAWLLTGDTYQWVTQISNLGSSSLSYTFPGFDTGSPPPGYIVNVCPATGIIPQGGVHEVTIFWDATGYGPGIYPQDLLCESNDPNNPVVAIGNLMEIQTPIYVSGTVIDSVTQLPIPGVEVTIGMRQTYTLADGSYFLIKDLGTYDFYYDKINYYSVVIPDTSSLIAGDTIIQDVEMMPLAYPVPWVLAESICNEPSPADVSWGLPEGPFEIIYDDGTAEDFFVWANANGENAVRFTPNGYPARIMGASVYVGNGTFPAGYWMGTEFDILVYDEDVNGMPGNVLDSTTVSVNNYEWITCWSLNPIIDSGDFFISMKQLNPAPNTAPIGVDMEAPTVNRSFSKMPGGSWGLSVYQDFMIRALLEEPTINPVDNYTIARISDFDPTNGPATGTMTIIANTMVQGYTDNSFQFIPKAWYAYAIQTEYAGGGASPWVYSNILGMDMAEIVTFQIEDCNGNGLENTEINMYGLDWPYEQFECVTDISGTCVFECTWIGWYEVWVYRYGYIDDEFDTYIGNDTVIGITLDQKLYPPRNLWVDTVTATAYWDEAMITALYDNFDDVVFWVNGWQMTTYGTGWLQTDDGGSIGFFIPSIGSTYVCVNDNL
ncbi:MAG: carboxypeptidase-like regulatory domain-containing protein, partial [Bacteroidales bacterium]|nr:carboxypeptidase-like regulatory domain-containing protein [Bacteroidales bacterium]